MCEHETRDTKFCLVVDDFGIKHTRDDDLQHLLSALRTKYKIPVDMEGTLFCGITLQWDYVNQTFQLSMTDYVILSLELFQHLFPNAKKDAPYEWKELAYVKKRQIVDDTNNSPPLLP